MLLSRSFTDTEIVPIYNFLRQRVRVPPQDDLVTDVIDQNPPNSEDLRVNVYLEVEPGRQQGEEKFLEDRVDHG